MLKAGLSFVGATISVVALMQTAYAGDEKKALLEELKNGGYVIYMRHPNTDKSTKDTDKKNLASCKTQRNLSEKGRDIARKVGEAVKKLNVKFSPVKTSEFCRARQVPALMGIDKFEKIADLNHSGGLKKEDADKRAAALKALMTAEPKSKENTLLIGHSPNITDLDADLISDGFKPADMIIVKPVAGKKEYKYVGRVTPAQWLDWASK